MAAEERELIQKLGQQKASFEARCNALFGGATPPTSALQSFIDFAGRLHAELTGLNAAAARLRAGGFPALETGLTSLSADVAKTREIVQSMVTGRKETDAKIAAINRDADTYVTKTLQEMHDNQRKAFDEANKKYNPK